MTITSDAQQKIETYLSCVRGQLRGVNEAAVRDIVDELRSHIMDKLAGSGDSSAASADAALNALGSPDELAREYVTDNLLARTEGTRSPLRILGALFRWASLSVAGFFVLVGSLSGYFLGIVFILWALLKPFHPHTAGLWASRDSIGDLNLSIRLGFGDVPPSAREVLGWWIVPIGLFAGCGSVLLTTRFAVWCARRFRAFRALP